MGRAPGKAQAFAVLMPRWWRKLRTARCWTWLVLAWALMSLGVSLSLRGLSGPALADAPLLAQLDWRPGLWLMQPWRLWTAAFVHWSFAHLAINLLACVALVAWGNAAGLSSRQTWAWVFAWPLTHLLLAGVAPLERYGGLSGVLHAGVAVGAWTLACHRRGQERVVGYLVLTGLLTKQMVETPLLTFGQGAEPMVRLLPGANNFHVAAYAHWSGIVAGLVCAAAVDAFASKGAAKFALRQ